MSVPKPFYVVVDRLGRAVTIFNEIVTADTLLQLDIKTPEDSPHSAWRCGESNLEPHTCCYRKIQENKVETT